MNLEKIREKALRPFVVDVNPNHVTLMSLILGVSAGITFAFNHLAIGILLVIVSGFLDLLDGEIAKKLNRTSKKGDIADHVADRIVDMSIFGGLALSRFVRTEIGFITAISVLMISYLGTQSQAVLGERLYKGMLGRFPRTLAIVVLSTLALIDYRFLWYGMSFLLGFAILTVLERLWEIHKKI
ncbi:MAG: CDP-alcohol phosphatidyltransferase family protein [archaeon]